MTVMHVANATAQFHEFVYQVPENPKNITQTIPPGGQVRISAKRGDLNSLDIDSILDQHRKYGLIKVEEIGSVSGFNGLCYSLGGPVSFTKLAQQIRRNREVMIDRGKISRQAAAVAVNQRLQTEITESGTGDVLKQLVVEIEEKTSAQIVGSRRDNEGLARELADMPSIAEGVRVSSDVEIAPPPARRRGRPPKVRY